MNSEVDGDELVAEYPVMVGCQLGQYLHLVQIPTHVSRTNITDSIPSLTGRYKKVSRRLELEVPLNTRHPNYASDYSKDLARAATQGSMRIVGASEDQQYGLGAKQQQQQQQMIDRVRLAGGPVPLVQAKYFVGRMVDGTVHLHPVASIIQMRPALWHLDEIDARTRAASRKLSHATGGGGGAETNATAKAVQVQFKRKETEEQAAARLCSYAYLQRKIDDEPWINLAHFTESSAESHEVSERLCQGRPGLSSHVTFEPVTTQAYIEQLLAPTIFT